jgi:hypothetical protein
MGAIQPTKMDGERLQQLVGHMLGAAHGEADNVSQMKGRLDEFDQVWSETETILAIFQRARVKLRRMLQAAEEVDAEFDAPSPPPRSRLTTGSAAFCCAGPPLKFAAR